MKDCLRTPFTDSSGKPLTRLFTAPPIQRNVVLYMQGTAQFSPSWFSESIKDTSTGIESTVLRIKDMPVFRSGSFKDSMGELTTWETIHVDQMVASFDFLRTNLVFPEVPVREGHGSFFGDPMTGLLGYHDAVRAQDALAPDGNTYRYLLADFTLNTPEAQQKFLSGLWKNRSSEVGYYESNDGTGYYPVYQGFAFVDIPAVQYLNLFSQDKKRSFSILLEKEIDMSNTATHTAPPAGQPAPTTPPPPVPDPTPPTPPTPTAAPAEPTAFSFACDGRQVNDYAAVQAYITTLEATKTEFTTFKAQAERQIRVDYVNKLAADKKILASQLGSDKAGEESGLIKLAIGMSAEQFADWRKLYDDAPELPLFGGQPGGGQQTPEENELSADEREFSQMKDQVDWLRSAKQPDDVVKTSKSYKRMVALATKLGKDVE